MSCQACHLGPVRAGQTAAAQPFQGAEVTGLEDRVLVGCEPAPSAKSWAVSPDPDPPRCYLSLPFQKPAPGASMSNLHMSPPSGKEKWSLLKNVFAFSQMTSCSHRVSSGLQIYVSLERTTKKNLEKIRRNLGHVSLVTFGESGVGGRWQLEQSDREDICIPVTSCK